MTDWTPRSPPSSSWSGVSSQTPAFISTSARSTSWISSFGLYVLSDYVDPDYVDGDTDTDTDWTGTAKSSTVWT